MLNAQSMGARESSDAHTNCGTCIFKSHCLPAELQGERLSQFERSVWHMHRPLRTGRVLVHQGEAMDSLYALRVGSLKAVINEIHGAEHVVGFRFPGTLIGLAEPEQSQWARTFVALEDTWLCRIPLGSIDDPLRRQLIRLVSERLRQEYEYHLTLAFKSGARKLAAFFMELSDNFCARGLSAHRFHLPMSYIDIASYLGMRHESVSRTLAKLQEAGLIEKRGKFIQISNLDVMRHAAEA